MCKSIDQLIPLCLKLCMGSVFRVLTCCRSLPAKEKQLILLSQWSKGISICIFSLCNCIFVKYLFLFVKSSPHCFSSEQGYSYLNLSSLCICICVQYLFLFVKNSPHCFLGGAGVFLVSDICIYFCPHGKSSPYCFLGGAREGKADICNPQMCQIKCVALLLFDSSIFENRQP